MWRGLSIVALFIVLGCSPEQAESVVQYDAEERIEQSVCTIETNGCPIATAFLVTFAGDQFLVTARHCIQTLRDEIPHIMVRTNDAGATASVPCFGRWQPADSGADVCALRITDRVESLKGMGARLSFIDLDLDPSTYLPKTNTVDALSGVGALNRKELSDAGIRIGSELYVLGTSVEVWDGYVDQSVMPVVYRSGRLSNVPRCKSYLQHLPKRDPRLPKTDLLVTDIPVVGGMSGGPVFAYGEKTPQGRPQYLIGVMVSIVPSRTNVGLLTEGFSLATNRQGCIVRFFPKKYNYLGNPFLSYVVPFDDVFECVLKASPPIAIPTQLFSGGNQ